MIESFADKRLRRLFENDERSKLPPDMLARIRQILMALSVATSIEEMNVPSFRLHPLKGDRKGFYAVTVRANWPVIFRFSDGLASAIELVDYH